MRTPIPEDLVEFIYLKDHREHVGWSIAKLARLSGVDARIITRIESGKLCTIQTESKLADALGLPPLIESPEQGLRDSQFCVNPEHYDDDERVENIKGNLALDPDPDVQARESGK